MAETQVSFSVTAALIPLTAMGPSIQVDGTVVVLAYDEYGYFTYSLQAYSGYVTVTDTTVSVWQFEESRYISYTLTEGYIQSFSVVCVPGATVSVVTGSSMVEDVITYDISTSGYYATDLVYETVVQTSNLVSDSDTTDSDTTDSDTTDSDTTDSDTTDSDTTDSDTSSSDSDTSSSDSDTTTDSDTTSGGSNVASSTITLVDSDPSGFYQSIYDYVGIPAPNTTDWISVKNNETYPTASNLSSLTETFQVNALPFRGYNLIYKEWFRDENLIDSPEVPKDDGVDDGSIYYLRKRAKRHDYFTSALPWTQKGDEVELPLAIVNSLSSSDFSSISLGSAGGNVTLADAESGTTLTDNGYLQSEYTPILTYDSDGNLGFFNTRVVSDSTGEVTGNTGGNYFNGAPLDAYLTTPSTTVKLTASQQLSMLSNAFDQLTIGPISINQLREAFQVQRLLERDARSGTRYTEILRGHFGVVSPDARLQRPEYLGGGSTPIAINTVAQTGSTDSTSPQGNLAAFGVAASRGNGFSKSFVEHGYIIGLVSIRGTNLYQQGLNRLWTRQTRYDFYWPVLAHLGEQAVYNYEIFFQNDTDEDETVFGYQERYAEYRYRPNQVTGLFRSSYRETLDFWHLAQDFENCPKLNQEFIEESLPVDRIVAVTSEPHFLLDMWLKDICTRPMPTYSVPGLVDHF